MRKNIDFASFSQYFGDCCRHIGSGMRGVVCNFFEGVVDIRSQEWWRVEMDNSKMGLWRWMTHYNGAGEMDDPKMGEEVEMGHRMPIHVVLPPPSFRLFVAPFI